MEEKMNNVEQITEEKDYKVEKKGFFTEEQKAKGKQAGKTIGKWVVRGLALGGAFLAGKALGSAGSKEDSDDSDIVYIIEPSDEQ